MSEARGQVRVSEFANILGLNRDTIRRQLHLEEAPVEQKKGEGKQRSFDGGDLLAYELLSVVQAGGMSLKAASSAIRLACIDRFLTDYIAGKDVRSVFFVYYRDCHTDPVIGFRDAAYSGLHTPDEIAHSLVQSVEKYGSKVEARDGSKIERLGVVNFKTESMQFILDRAKDRARAAGYVMDGFKLFKVAGSVQGDKE